MAVFGRRQPHKPIILGLGPPPRVAKIRTPGARCSLAAAQAAYRQAPRTRILKLGITSTIIPIGNPPIGVSLLFGQQSREAALFARRPKSQTQIKKFGSPPSKARLQIFDKASRDASLVAHRPLFPVIQRTFSRFVAPTTITVTITDTGNPTDSCFALKVNTPLNQLSPDIRASQRTRHQQQRHARADAGYHGQETIDTVGTVSTGTWQADPVSPDYLAVLFAVTCVMDSATTTVPANTYANADSGVGATLTFNAAGTVTLDGHQLALNDTVLVINDAGLSLANGVYLVTTAPSATTAGVLTRHPAFDRPQRFFGSTIVSQVGTHFGLASWLCTLGPTFIGIDGIQYQQTIANLPGTSSLIAFSNTASITFSTSQTGFLTGLSATVAWQFQQLAATGTAQAGAAAITNTTRMCVVTVADASHTGVILPSTGPQPVFVAADINAAASAVVYCPVGGTMNGNLNGSVTLVAGSSKVFWSNIGGTAWWSVG